MSLKSTLIIFVFVAVLSLQSSLCAQESVRSTEPLRARDVEIPFEGTTGTNNAITDVEGVLVGHKTIIEGADETAARSGVTAVLPNATLGRVFAATHVFNGNGEMTGDSYVNEYGYLISPIMLTNTISVGTVRDSVVKWARQREQIGRDVNLPLVAETWDGFLNDIYGFHVKQDDVFEALDSATVGPIAEGNVGGGTGMMCHWFKGGIGTSSRKLDADSGGYTVGVLVQANYGNRGEMQIAGVPVGKKLQKLWPERGKKSEGEGQQEDGSIIVVIATDAPMLPHQLQRVAKRASLGLARMGSHGSTESGDIYIAFSTTGLKEGSRPLHRSAEFIDEGMIDLIFTAVVQATEEAIVNALVAAETMTGKDGNTVHAMPVDEVVLLLKNANRIDE